MAAKKKKNPYFNCFKGEVFYFHGNFRRDKSSLKDAVIADGGTISDKLTDKVTTLVHGSTNAKGPGPTRAKMEKLNAAGARISELNENQFILRLAVDQNEAVTLLKGGAIAVERLGYLMSYPICAIEDLTIEDADLSDSKLKVHSFNTAIAFQRTNFNRANITDYNRFDLFECTFDHATFSSATLGEIRGCSFPNAQGSLATQWLTPIVGSNFDHATLEIGVNTMEECRGTTTDFSHSLLRILKNSRFPKSIWEQTTIGVSHCVAKLP